MPHLQTAAHPAASPGHPPNALVAAAASATESTLFTLDSHTLLQGHQAVAIQHNGMVYRLQATRLGKLILTK